MMRRRRLAFSNGWILATQCHDRSLFRWHHYYLLLFCHFGMSSCCSSSMLHGRRHDCRSADRSIAWHRHVSRIIIIIMVDYYWSYFDMEVVGMVGLLVGRCSWFNVLVVWASPLWTNGRCSPSPKSLLVPELEKLGTWPNRNTMNGFLGVYRRNPSVCEVKRGIFEKE